MRLIPGTALVLLFALCALPVCAADSTAAFDAANRLYEKIGFTRRETTLMRMLGSLTAFSASLM